MLGKRHSAAARRLISSALTGRLVSAETRAKIGASNSVKRRTVAQKRAISLSLRGRVLSEDVKNKIAASLLGIRRSEETRRKLSGRNNHNWRGGIGSANVKVRNSLEYRSLFTNAVFSRDDYTCRSCGKRSGALQAHHIMPFAWYEDLRFEVYNGLTLCKGKCHKDADKATRYYRPQSAMTQEIA